MNVNIYVLYLILISEDQKDILSYILQIIIILLLFLSLLYLLLKVNDRLNVFFQIKDLALISILLHEIYESHCLFTVSCGSVVKLLLKFQLLPRLNEWRNLLMILNESWFKVTFRLKRRLNLKYFNYKMNQNSLNVLIYVSQLNEDLSLTIFIHF